MRKAVTEIVRTKVKSIEIDDERLAKYLGVRCFRHGEIEAEAQVGVVTGLAWT